MSSGARPAAPAGAAFRNLHESGCFVLPNVWAGVTASFVGWLGFPALATTSAALAFSLGLPGAVSAIPIETMLAHVREIVEATPVPVSADFQAGYAREPDDVAANVKRCVETGVAGLSIEDATENRNE